MSEHDMFDADMFAAPHPALVSEDGGPDDPFWQTARDAQLMGELRDVEVAQAQERANEVTQQKAEQDAREAESLQAQATWQAEKTERDAAEDLKRAEQAERERLEFAGWLAENEAERVAKQAAEDAFFANLCKQDDDFHTLQFSIVFKIEGASLDGARIDEDTCPEFWELSEDEETNRRMGADLVADVTAAIEPWVSHYSSLGLIRADYANYKADRERDAWCGPRFFLVHSTADADQPAETLADFAPVKIALPAPADATLTLHAAAAPINATMLHDAMQRGGLGVGQWGGEETPDMAPAPDESRAEWLERVALGEEVITRAADRWAASGREPLIYRQFGDFTERSDGDREVECLVHRRIFRGALTFLVGDSGVGKSSLVHEWVAALSGVAKGRPTSVLGEDVTGRYICALISAEDGPGRISQRAKDHAKIWDRCTYYAPADPLIGLEEHLQTLRQFPKLDLVVFDPLRSYLDGNEDASDVAERVCAILGEFAREMNCAVVLPHHIKKAKLPPRTLAEVYDRMRGSTAFKASARMVICILKRRDGTVVIGPAKHNFADGDVWLPLMQGDTYRVDPETSTLIPVDGLADEASGPDNGPRPLDLEPRVLAAIRRSNSAGNVVRRSGKLGLFESRAPELASLARATILDTVAALLASGSLVDGPTGLRLAARPEAAGEGSTNDV